ncbi:sulfatase [Nocardioides sp.]|uniref:sulfatase family protein n=1 Tax=Nocardioides sp. TaxID=35761 RepID=UPI002ED1808C
MRMLGRLALGGLLAATSTALVTAGATRAPATAAQGTPNVVLVLVDDGRVDDLAAMPRVRQLIGAAGVSFTDFYAPFPLCCPARATLLTGQYAHNHGVLGNTAPGGGFRKFRDQSTLATWLTPTYRTGLIGKYLNGYAPPYRPPGWDEWMVPSALYGYTGTRWYVHRGTGGGYQTISGYQTDTIAALASDFVARNAPQEEPFFLFTSIVAPHDGQPRDPDDVAGYPSPYVKPVYRDRFAGLTNTDPSFDEADVSDKPIRPTRLSSTDIRGITEHLQQRREASLSIDDAVARIMQALTDSGELADTYVIFASDNGLMLGEHRIRGGKSTPYEVANRIPFLVRGPGIPAGSEVHQVAGQIDFAATVMAMAGLPAPSSVDGASLLELLHDPGSAGPARRGVLLEATANSDTETPPWHYRGVVDGNWKYVERATGRKELYDLVADPFELTNLAGRAAYAQPQQELAQLLFTLRECDGSQCR